MRPEKPWPALIPGLRALWKEAFGDTDAFLDLFFSTAYAPSRCRCILSEGRPAAALYWLDLWMGEKKFAYIYAVATAEKSRGQGLCRILMEATAADLKAAGYSGALLVPQDEALRAMYGRMGYLSAGAIDEFFCATGEHSAPGEEITPEAYAALRPSLLPPGSPAPDSTALAFLGVLARFYRGEDFLAVASREQEHLRILEYLGDRDRLPGFIAGLGAAEATVRAPGNGKPFAMYRPLTPDCKKPTYFPFAFD